MSRNANAMSGVVWVVRVAFICNKLTNFMIDCSGNYAWLYQTNGIFKCIINNLMDLCLCWRLFTWIVGAAAITPIAIQDDTEIDNNGVRFRDLIIQRPPRVCAASKHTIVAQWNSAPCGLFNCIMSNTPHVNLAFADGHSVAGCDVTNITQTEISSQDGQLFGSLDLAQSFQPTVNRDRAVIRSKLCSDQFADILSFQPYAHTRSWDSQFPE